MFRAIIADSPSNLSFYAADTSLATTKAFTHGRLIFDLQASTLTVATMAPFPIPSALVVEVGCEVKMRLIAPSGIVKRQTRTGIIVQGARGKLRIPGRVRTPSSRSAEDGWGYTCRRYRAYLTHPGVPGSSTLPGWLTDSIARQQKLWNRVVMHCRTALSQCADVPPEDIRAFVNGTILPAIDDFNCAQGREPKIKHPSELKSGEPSVAALRRFARELGLRARQGRPVPENLEAIVTDWASRHVIDYAPIQRFERELDHLIKQEADALELRHWERRAVTNSLLSTFDRRRMKLPISKGWPRYSESTDSGPDRWAIHYYLNSATVPASAVLNGGVQSLRFRDPLPPERTGHPHAHEKAFGSRRQFRVVEIDIPDRASGERRRLLLSIVQHQPIPDGSFLKEWKLVHRRGKLHLILVLQVKGVLPPDPAENTPVAGMDLGWRRDGCGVRVATLFNPVRNAFTTVFVDLVNRVPDTGRQAFCVFMGPSRRGIREVLAAARQNRPGFLDTVDGCRQLQRARDLAREAAKVQIRTIVGAGAPAWLERAGRRGLQSLRESTANLELKQLVSVWLAEDTRMADQYRAYSERIQGRLQKGYEGVAHDIGRMLQADGIRFLALEDPFLAEASQRAASAGQPALREGAHYRYWVAPSKLVRALELILPSYGIAIRRRSRRNTTRHCHRCGTTNDFGAALHLQCRGCGALLNQDNNAAVNLASGEIAEEKRE